MEFPLGAWSRRHAVSARSDPVEAARFDKLGTDGDGACQLYPSDMADARASCHAAAMVVLPYGCA
jgi:hypothetical protein